jgi:hypothetical protein
MTIAEAQITRELGIRFIDARSLTVEARLQEGIVGYPTEEQKAKLIQTAIKLFNKKSEAMQNAMKTLNDDLESLKSTHSLRSKQNDMDGSDHTQSTIASQGSNSEGSMMRRVVSLGGLIMRKRSSGNLRSQKNLRSSRKSFLSNPISEDATFVDNSMGKNETFNPDHNLRKVSSLGGLHQHRPKKSTSMPPKNISSFGGLTPKVAAASRVSRLGSLLDIKVPH